MKNLKVDFTISTGKQYENVHVSAEVDTLLEGKDLGFTAEEMFHDCYKNYNVEQPTNEADISETDNLNFEK